MRQFFSVLSFIFIAVRPEPFRPSALQPVRFENCTSACPATTCSVTTSLESTRSQEVQGAQVFARTCPPNVRLANFRHHFKSSPFPFNQEPRTKKLSLLLGICNSHIFQDCHAFFTLTCILVRPILPFPRRTQHFLSPALRLPTSDLRSPISDFQGATCAPCVLLQTCKFPEDFSKGSKMLKRRRFFREVDSLRPWPGA
jgi:hypothetical protein